MAIYQNLAAFGVGQLVNGALSTVGLGGSGEAVVAFLAARFADHSGKLTAALEVANDRAGKPSRSPWPVIPSGTAARSFSPAATIRPSASRSVPSLTPMLFRPMPSEASVCKSCAALAKSNSWRAAALTPKRWPNKPERSPASRIRKPY